MTPSSFGLSNQESGFNYTENIQVFLRIRPLNNLETSREDSKCVELANQQMIFFNAKNMSRNYSFNYIFGENSSQEEVFHNSQMDVILNLFFMFCGLHLINFYILEYINVLRK